MSKRFHNLAHALTFSTLFSSLILTPAKAETEEVPASPSFRLLKPVPNPNMVGFKYKKALPVEDEPEEKKVDTNAPVIIDGRPALKAFLVPEDDEPVAKAIPVMIDASGNVVPVSQKTPSTEATNAPAAPIAKTIDHTKSKEDEEKEREEQVEQAVNLLLATGSGMALVSAAGILWHQREEYKDILAQGKRALDALIARQSRGENVTKLVNTLNDYLYDAEYKYRRQLEDFRKKELALSANLKMEKAQLDLIRNRPNDKPLAIDNIDKWLTPGKSQRKSRLKFAINLILGDLPFYPAIQKKMDEIQGAQIIKDPRVSAASSPKLDSLRLIDEQIRAMNEEIQKARATLEHKQNIVAKYYGPEIKLKEKRQASLIQEIHTLVKNNHSTLYGQDLWEKITSKTNAVKENPESAHAATLQTEIEALQKELDRHNEERMASLIYDLDDTSKVITEIRDEANEETKKAMDEYRARRLQIAELMNGPSPMSEIERNRQLGNLQAQITKLKTLITKAESSTPPIDVEKEKAQVKELEIAKEQVIARFEAGLHSDEGLFSKYRIKKYDLKAIAEHANSVEKALRELVASHEKELSVVRQNLGLMKEHNHPMEAKIDELNRYRDSLLSKGFSATRKALPALQAELADIDKKLAEGRSNKTIHENDSKLENFRRQIADAEDKIQRAQRDMDAVPLLSKLTSPEYKAAERRRYEASTKRSDLEDAMEDFLKDKSNQTTESLMTRSQEIHERMDRYNKQIEDTEQYLKELAVWVASEDNTPMKRLERGKPELTLTTICKTLLSRATGMLR